MGADGPFQSRLVTFPLGEDEMVEFFVAKGPVVVDVRLVGVLAVFKLVILYVTKDEEDETLTRLAFLSIDLGEHTIDFRASWAAEDALESGLTNGKGLGLVVGLGPLSDDSIDSSSTFLLLPLLLFPTPLIVLLLTPPPPHPLQESDAFKRPSKGLNARPEQSQMRIPFPRAVARRMGDDDCE